MKLFNLIGAESELDGLLQQMEISSSKNSESSKKRSGSNPVDILTSMGLRLDNPTGNLKAGELRMKLKS